jgi:hypothetical protein
VTSEEEPSATIIMRSRGGSTCPVIPDARASSPGHHDK